MSKQISLSAALSSVAELYQHKDRPLDYQAYYREMNRERSLEEKQPDLAPESPSAAPDIGF